MSAILFGLIKYTSLPGAKRAIMWVLADHASDGGHCFPGRALLSKEVGITERHLRINLQALEKEGWLRMELGNGRGNPTRYHLNVPKIRRESAEFERAFPIKGIPNNTPFPGDPLDKGCTLEDEKGIPSRTKGYTPRINEPSVTIREPSLLEDPSKGLSAEDLERLRAKYAHRVLDFDEQVAEALAHPAAKKWVANPYLGLSNWLRKNVLPDWKIKQLATSSPGSDSAAGSPLFAPGEDPFGWTDEEAKARGVLIHRG